MIGNIRWESLLLSHVECWVIVKKRCVVTLHFVHSTANISLSTINSASSSSGYTHMMDWMSFLRKSSPDINFDAPHHQDEAVPSTQRRRHPR